MLLFEFKKSTVQLLTVISNIDFCLKYKDFIPSVIEYLIPLFPLTLIYIYQINDK